MYLIIATALVEFAGVAGSGTNPISHDSLPVVPPLPPRVEHHKARIGLRLLPGLRQLLDSRKQVLREVEAESSPKNSRLIESLKVDIRQYEALIQRFEADVAGRDSKAPAK